MQETRADGQVVIISILALKSVQETRADGQVVIVSILASKSMQETRADGQVVIVGCNCFYFSIKVRAGN